MKVLRITLKKKWFGMTDSGEKPFEYREVNDYWINRLVEFDLPEKKWMHKDLWEELVTSLKRYDGYAHISVVFNDFEARFKKFDAVFAMNGYNPKINPSWTRKFEGITIAEGRPEWGAEPGKKYFVIKLGEKL